MARAARLLVPLALLASTTPAACQRSPGWVRLASGALVSILAHEAGHVLTAVALGGRPSLGFDRMRPVVYSGVNVGLHPHRQFVFSASGMTVQLLLNELILDWPRRDARLAGAFERGMLAGGIGTILFYFTVGRNSSVSDVDQMARYSGLSKWTLTAIFGGVAATDVLRIAMRDRYGPHFFVLPGPERTLRIGATTSW